MPASEDVSRKHGDAGESQLAIGDGWGGPLRPAVNPAESSLDLDGILAEVLDTALAVSAADFGNIQLRDPASGHLIIRAQRGLPDWWLDYWRLVSKGQGTCGAAMQAGGRVIVEDVEQSPLFVGTPALEIQRRAGVRAIQSTPLLTRAGELLGMFSTHFRSPHRPDKRELRLLDLLARHAADRIESVKLDRALRLSEQRFRLFAEHAPAAVAIFDSQMRYLAVSRRWKDDYHPDIDNVIGQSLYELVPYIPERWKVIHRRVLSGEVVRAEKDYFERFDGRLQWLRWEARPWYGEGSVHGMAVYLEDISERVHTESALLESEQAYRVLFTHSPNAIFVIQNERISLVNATSRRQFGVNSERQFAGRLFHELFAPDCHMLIRSRLRQLTEPGEVAEVDARIVRLDGGVVEVEVTLVATRLKGEGAILAVLRDIADRRRLERTIIDVSTAEQQRIGQEIHDGIGQRLTALGMLASSLERKLNEAGNGSQARVAGELAKHLRHALSDARTLARGLSPVHIGPEGLPDALTLLVQDTQAATGVLCRFSITGGVITSLPEAAANHLYRIAQEALANALKYAQAGVIDVQLRSCGSKIVLAIRDDGVGIPATRLGQPGIGLKTMSARAGVIGAALTVVALDTGGTLVECVWHRDDQGAGQNSR